MIIMKGNGARYCCDAAQRYCCDAAHMIAEGIKPLPSGTNVCSPRCARALSEAVAQEGLGPIVDGHRIRGRG